MGIPDVDVNPVPGDRPSPMSYQRKTKTILLKKNENI